MRTSPPAAVAAVLLALEGLGIAALAVWETIAILTGDTTVLSTALALIVLTAVFAVVVISFAVGVWRDQSWGRSGGIVTQLLILAVALGAATGAYGDPVTAVFLAAPAVLTLVLLVLAVRAAGRSDRSARGEGSDAQD